MLPMNTRALALAAAVGTAAAGGGIAVGASPASAASWCYAERVTFTDSYVSLVYKVHTSQQCNTSTSTGTYATMIYRTHKCDFLDFASYHPGDVYTGAHYGWCT